MRIRKIIINGEPFEIEGKSAHEIAQEHGAFADEQVWLDSLKGEKGDPGKDGTVTNIVQTTGDDETAVMSQKAATDALTEGLSFARRINLFNAADANNLTGYFFDIDGQLIQFDAFLVTHPIQVEARSYKMPFNAAGLGTNNKCRIEDADGGLLGVVEGDTSEPGFIVFTFAEKCIARFNTTGAAQTDTFMVCASEEYPDQYVPYGVKIDAINIGDTEQLDTDNKQSLVGAINEVNGKTDRNANPLWGKKLAVNGDSICRGEGFAGGYAGLIAQRNGMTLQNIAVSGATIATGTKLGSADRHWISATVSAMDEDADIVIVEGGVNDAALTVPLGTISTRYGSTPFDTTTFCGAFEQMLMTLTHRFAGKKIGYIAVHKMVVGFLSTKALPPKDLEDAAYTQYYDAAKKACEKWGVPFLDLNTAVPPLGFFTAASIVPDELKALAARYTKDGDGWHPNEDGYLKYYVPKIEAWLKTL